MHARKLNWFASLPVRARSSTQRNQRWSRSSGVRANEKKRERESETKSPAEMDRKTRTVNKSLNNDDVQRASGCLVE